MGGFLRQTFITEYYITHRGLRVLRKLLNRKSDTRAVLVKAICRELAVPDIDVLTQAQSIRGDIESKGWRTREVQCLYCGRKATEVDHYKSVVFKGKGRFIPETAANRAPSCSGCHRAGKDRHEDIVEWHRMRSGSKNHPRNVVTHAEWERAHEKVKQFDRFNRAHAREISGGSAYGMFVEDILHKMYDANIS